MSHPNYAGNIIVILSNLPDFLRIPVLKNRMMEFFSMSESEKVEIINNALEAGPIIPYPNFSKLIKTWLEILATFSENQREEIFTLYIKEIVKKPQKLIAFNLDGIWGIFLSIEDNKKEILSQTIKKILNDLNGENKRIILLIIPENAKRHFQLI